MIHSIIALNASKTMVDSFDVFVDFAKTSPKESEAARLFRRYVKQIALANQCSDVEAMQMARNNILWYAGYYDKATQQMIYNVYNRALRSK